MSLLTFLGAVLVATPVLMCANVPNYDLLSYKSNLALPSFLLGALLLLLA